MDLEFTVVSYNMCFCCLALSAGFIFYCEMLVNANGSCDACNLIHVPVAFKLSKRKADANLHLLHTILFGKKAKVLFKLFFLLFHYVILFLIAQRYLLLFRCIL